jgi:hypothetical protein
MRLAFSPVFLGKGENLFADLNLAELGFVDIQTTFGKGAMHVILRKSSASNSQQS